MSGATFKLFGQELRIHDLSRFGVSTVPTEDSHEVGAHVSSNVQASDTSGVSLGFGASGHISSNSRLVGGNANFFGPVFFAVWAGIEAEVLHNLDSNKTQLGVSAGAFGVLPVVEVPIYLKAGLLDVTDLGSWSITLGVGLSFEFLRAP